MRLEIDQMKKTINQMIEAINEMQEVIVHSQPPLKSNGSSRKRKQ